MSAITRESLDARLATMEAEILTKAAIPPHILDQYRTVLELQQKCIDEERVLWEQERQHFNTYISTLERSLTFYQAGTVEKYKNPEKSYVSTGDEVWRGSGEKGSSGPTKPSLDTPFNPSNGEGRLRSIEGNASSEKSKAPFVMGTGISVPEKDKDFEGINFKENIRAPPIAESLMASHSATPLRFQSPTRGILTEGAKPSSLLAAPPDLFSKDAGHKPRASQVDLKMDSSAVSSSLATPIHTDPEKSPREPHPSAVKITSEQVYKQVPSDGNGGDPELKGPLGLKNNNLEDKIFLRELDTKLLEAAKSITVEEPVKSKKDNSRDDVGFHQPEPEPELQLKPSMNFGSPFGAPYCGKGI